MWLVLKGDLTLGMLIGLRIISGNAGPLLQLSSLYQGFQKVWVSLERLSDILDQNPELSREEDIDQISMPLSRVICDLKTLNLSAKWSLPLTA